MTSLKFLLRNGGGKSLDVLHPYNNKDYPIQQACKKGLVKGLPLVTTILKCFGAAVHSLGCCFLWLRLLRVLTISPSTGMVALMFFKMLQKIFQWFSILIVIVAAFTAGVYKLNFTSSSDAENEEKCKMVTSHVGLSFKQLFEDAISGGGSDLFDCQEGESAFSFGNVLLYLATLICQILLMNMLIAMMNAAFMSIYEAQEPNHTYQKATHY